MYPDWSLFLLFGGAVIFIWAGILSIFVWRQNKFLKSLFPKAGERDIRKKFEEVVRAVENFRTDLSDLEKRILKYQKEGAKHMQRVAIMRFNPYNDTGGDQSFTACFLDEEGSGVIITSLHARSGTRVFGKEILSGKSVKYDLSKEEKTILEKAMKNNE